MKLQVTLGHIPFLKWNLMKVKLETEKFFEQNIKMKEMKKATNIKSSEISISCKERDKTIDMTSGERSFVLVMLWYFDEMTLASINYV